MRSILPPILAALLLPAGLRAEDPAARTVRPGEVFSLRLASNMTTGFQWSLPEPPDGKVVVLVDHRYVSPARKLPGAGGAEVWRFRAVARGEATITLQYARSWEKDVPPAEVAVYHILVR
jgi:predicted secreted protein